MAGSFACKLELNSLPQNHERKWIFFFQLRKYYNRRGCKLEASPPLDIGLIAEKSQSKSTASAQKTKKKRKR